MPVLESNADTKYLLQLPTVSFRVVDDKSLDLPAGVSSGEIRSYGYNDFSDFVRKEHYIRYIEPIESELRAQVEYDMDEQDQAWLDAINAERQKEQSGPISYEVFEILVDKLEKEWFELSKRIPQPASHLPVEDSKCAVCDDGEGENSNAIVFCDGCNLAVHQDCYGVPYIPEGQWLCRKCTVSPENPVSCLFCPNEGGAFKQTSTGHWSHLLCAIWIPELGVGNAIYMEPVEGVESIPKNRWKLVCSLCREKTGACVQCDNRNCFTAFHVTCARQCGLLQSMKAMGADTQLRAFCHKHLPADARDSGDMDDEADSNFSGTPAAPRIKLSIRGAVTTKSARAHAKSYRPGPPIVPNVIVKSLVDYVGKLSIRKRQQFIERLCRYWSLKREARRGAPLLKRLHLEPWTASKTDTQQTEAEKALKLEFTNRLRTDMEKVRLLVDNVKKREKEKLRQMQVIKETIDQFLFPQYPRLRLILEKVSSMDRAQVFMHPVSRAEVPDYYDVVKQPMCWSMIDGKLERNAYIRLADFTRDIQLVWENAILYNAADTPFHKTAQRIKVVAQPLLDGLSSITAQSTLSLFDDAEVPDQSNVGDLEPSLLNLQVLLAPETPDGNRDNLASLFAYELEEPRPPTPSPPTPPPAPVRKSLTAAERRILFEEREAKAKERAALSGRGTRGAKALEKAFAEEAGVNVSSSDVELVAGRRTRGRPSGLVFDTPVKGKEVSDKKRSDRKRQDKAGTPKRNGHPSEALAVPAPTVSEDRSTEDTREISEDRPMIKEASVDTTTTRRSRTQPGVAALEVYSHVSDRERRNAERALDIVTEEVDNKDQFKRFNVGWVLPEGSKRRRVEKAPDPPKTLARQRKSSSNLPAESYTSHPTMIAAPVTPRGSLSPAPPSGSSLTPVSSSKTSSQMSPASDHIEVAPSNNKRRKLSKGRPSQLYRINGKFASNTPQTPSKKRKRESSGLSTASDRTQTVILAAETVPDTDDEEMTPIPSTSPTGPAGATTIDIGEELGGDTGTLEEITAEVMPRGAARSKKSSVAGESPNKRLIKGRQKPAPKASLGRRESTRGSKHNTAIMKHDVTGDASSASNATGTKPDEEQHAQISVSAGQEEETKSRSRSDNDGHEAEDEHDDVDEEAEDEEEEEEEEEEGEEDPYPPRTLVWAKSKGFPYFPAEIMDPDLIDETDRIPLPVLESKERFEQLSKAPCWLVRFFDARSSYCWVPAKDLDFFGVDEKDELYLNGKDGRTKSFKTPALRKQCQEGYRLAQQALQGVTMSAGEEEE